MKYAFSLFLLLMLALPGMAGTLQGRITDEKGEGLAFANVYVKGTTNGTTANEKGYYQFKLEAGTYEIVFQYIGYKPHIETVNLGEGTLERNVKLQPDVFALKEVVVKASGKDPAYAMMKAAIERRKYHQKETEAYKCRVYIKNLQRLTDVPNRILWKVIDKTDFKPGIVYLSESVSELSFKQPDKYREKVISSKVSGRSKTISYNQATDFDLDFYENLIKVEGLTQRGFVSPLASNAFLFYKFQLMGTSQENGRHIHKIRVTPLRKNDPAFSGYVYLVDGEWRLQSVDLGLAKNTQLEFLDSAHVRQVFTPIGNSGVWLPISQKVTLEFSVMGFKGNGYINVVYSQYQVQPAPYVLAAQAAAKKAETEAQLVVAADETPKPAPKISVKKLMKRKPKEPVKDELFDKKHFNNELLGVEKGANEKDSTYWENERPIPLTEEEIKDYQTKDSLQAIVESKSYKDSVDRRRNEFHFTSLFFGGYSYNHSFSRQRFSTDPLLAPLEYNSFLQFNTVEGLVLNPGFQYRKSYEDRRHFEVVPMLRYGFSSENFYYNLKGSYYYNPLKNATFSLEGGKFVSQFNPANPISTFWNSVYTLLAERNYMKLYEKRYVKLEEKSEIVNGLNILANLEYADRVELFNASDFTFSDRQNRSFTPNLPQNAELGNNASFGRSQALTLLVNLQWRPGQQYISRPNRKINLASKYPAFTLGYSKGIKALGSDVGYDRLAILVNDEVPLGLFGTSNYWFTAGTFFNKQNMELMDYRHFTGNRTIFAGGFGGFQLLDYYAYSTNNRYLEAHYSHHFDGFILNKIPFIRRGLLQEVVNVNYLNTLESKHYLEVGIGLEHIFKFFRADFYTGFQEGQKVRSGFRFGIGF